MAQILNVLPGLGKPCKHALVAPRYHSNSTVKDTPIQQQDDCRYRPGRLFHGAEQKPPSLTRPVTSNSAILVPAGRQLGWERNASAGKFKALILQRESIDFRLPQARGCGAVYALVRAKRDADSLHAAG